MEKFWKIMVVWAMAIITVLVITHVEGMRFAYSTTTDMSNPDGKLRVITTRFDRWTGHTQVLDEGVFKIRCN
jgi:hypothetical protein